MRLEGKAGALYLFAFALLRASPHAKHQPQPYCPFPGQEQSNGLGGSTLQQRLDADRLCFIWRFLVCLAGPEGGKLAFLFCLFLNGSSSKGPCRRWKSSAGRILKHAGKVKADNFVWPCFSRLAQYFNLNISWFAVIIIKSSCFSQSNLRGFRGPSMHKKLQESPLLLQLALDEIHHSKSSFSLNWQSPNVLTSS